jgi:hypothetical protein
MTTVRAALIASVLATVVPATAHAQELGQATTTVTTALDAASHERAGAATLAMLRATTTYRIGGEPTGVAFENGIQRNTPANIRLSSGAKTAIIIVAIVGGILIIVGVLALRGPKHL